MKNIFRECPSGRFSSDNLIQKSIATGSELIAQEFFEMYGNKIGYFDNVLSDAGKPILATITVYLAGTTTKATIYADVGGTIVKDNPFITDALGRFQFFAASGAYDIEVIGAGITTYKIEYVQLSNIIESQELSDMPSSLQDQATKLLRVKADETGYEHVAAGGSAGIVPVGSVVPYFGGYMTDGVNGGFTMVMATANTVAAVNTLLNPSGWYVCNGAALNHASSPIWNAAGRYLYYISDDCFLMGDTLAGGIGGSNSSAHTHVAGGYVLTHTHVAGTLALAHTHQVNPPDTESGAAHSAEGKPVGTLTNDATPFDHHHHVDIAEFTSGAASTSAVTGSTGAASTEAVTGSSGAASVTENRPSYLSCFYIVRAF